MVTKKTQSASPDLAIVLQSDIATTISGNVTNPPTNRGLELQRKVSAISSTAYIHWIQAIVHGDVHTLVDFVKGTIRRTPSYNYGHTTTRGKSWDNFVEFSCGTKIFYDDDEKQMNHCLLVMAGSVCEQIGTESCYRFIRGLFFTFEARFTRLDFKVRIPEKLVSLDTIIQAGLDRNYKQVRSAPTSHVSRIFDGRELREFWTHEFGSRQSQSMTRFYNPEVKHKIRGYVDIEAELKDHKANQSAKLLSELPNGIPRDVIAMTIAGMALGQLDFIDRAFDKNVSRCPRLAWWEEVIEVLAGAVIKLEAPAYQPTFHRFRGFVERQVVSGLAAYKKAVGTKRFHAWLHSIIAEKQDNLSRTWQVLIEDSKVLGAD